MTIFLSSQLYTVILEKNWEGSFPCSASLPAVAIVKVSSYNYLYSREARLSLFLDNNLIKKPHKTTTYRRLPHG